jgi:hypothetical protein
MPQMRPQRPAPSPDSTVSQDNARRILLSRRSSAVGSGSRLAPERENPLAKYLHPLIDRPTCFPQQVLRDPPTTLPAYHSESVRPLLSHGTK